MPKTASKIKDFPVMAGMCPSCPFGKNGDAQTREMVTERCMSKASQICHHPRLHGKKETHLCRGARNLQLEMFHAMGFIKTPTDEAWQEKRKELGI